MCVFFFNSAVQYNWKSKPFRYHTHLNIMEHLTVTFIKPHRGFLQIYGHKKPELLNQLELEISAYQPYTKKIATTVEIHPNLEFDTIYLALNVRSKKYHRCTVQEKRPCNKAIIELVDFGNTFEVDTSLVSVQKCSFFYVHWFMINDRKIHMKPAHRFHCWYFIFCWRFLKCIHSVWIEHLHVIIQRWLIEFRSKWKLFLELVVWVSTKCVLRS